MIRIYFDSDVLNGLRSGNFPELYAYIESNRDKILTPFSSAHVSDKIPSKKINEELFWRDIDFISSFSEKKYLDYDNGIGLTRQIITDARAVYDHIEENNELLNFIENPENILNHYKKKSVELGHPEIGERLQEIFDEKINEKGDSFLDQLKQAAEQIFGLKNDPQQYKSKMDQMQKSINLPTHANQWIENEIEKLNEYIRANKDLEFDDYMEMVVRDLDNIGNKDQCTQFLNAYTLFNFLGFHADKIELKKNKGFPNHLQDSLHSYYAGHCDFFVSMDKKLSAKSRILYRLFNVNTQVVHPKDLLSQVEEILLPMDFNELVSETFKQTPVQVSVEENVQKSVYRLKNYYLNYFSHIQLEIATNSNERMIIFAKMYPNFSKFIFDQEIEVVISKVNVLFGGGFETEQIIERFKTEKEPVHIYSLENGYIRLFFGETKFYLCWVF